MALKTDYKDYIPPSGERKYKITANSDGSSSIEDITQYQQIGDTWGAEDINQITKTLNGRSYGNEVDTGLTWLDGKKIYRKTAKITPSQYAVLEEGDPVTYTATIENWMVGINEICMLQGMLVSPEGYYLPLGAKRNGNNDYGGYIAASIENNIVKLTIGTGARPLAASNISHFTVICEYTKI